MKPHCVDPAFVESLSRFVQAYVSESERKRQRDLRERQILAEIQWCRADIRRLELMGRRRPSVHRLVAQRVHEIRHREIELAFLSEEVARV